MARRTSAPPTPSARNSARPGKPPRATRPTRPSKGAGGGEKPKKAPSRGSRASKAPAAVRGPAEPKTHNRRLTPKASQAPDAPREVRVPWRFRLASWRRRGADWASSARRPARIAGKLALGVFLVVGLLATGRLVERHVRTSPAFATQTAEVEGNERLTVEEVLEAAGLAVGKNAFETPPDGARERLLAHPWIASAEVSRRLPGTFRVAITERKAVAVLALAPDGEQSAALYLVGDDGVVFKRVADGDPVDLPMITGAERGRFVDEPRYREGVLLEAVTLLEDWRAAGLWRREPIGEIHVEADGALSLYVGAEVMHVRLGHGPHRTKLGRLRRVIDRLESERSRAAYVYLDNVRRPDRVTVRLAN